MSSQGLDSATVTDLRMELCSCLSEVDLGLDLQSRMEDEAGVLMERWVAEFSSKERLTTHVLAQEKLALLEQQYDDDSKHYKIDNGEIAVLQLPQPVPGQKVLSNVPLPVSGPISKALRQALRLDGLIQAVYERAAPVALTTYLTIAPKWLSRGRCTHTVSQETPHYSTQPQFLYLRNKLALYVLLPVFTNKQFYKTLQQMICTTSLPFALQRQVLQTKRLQAGSNLETQHDPRFISSLLLAACPQLFPVVACRCMQNVLRAYITGLTVFSSRDEELHSRYLSCSVLELKECFPLQLSAIQSLMSLYGVFLHKEHVLRGRANALLTAMSIRKIAPSTLPIADLQRPSVLEVLSTAEYQTDHIDATQSSSHMFYLVEMEELFRLLLLLPRQDGMFSVLYDRVGELLYRACLSHQSVYARVRCLRLLQDLATYCPQPQVKALLLSAPYQFHSTLNTPTPLNLASAKQYYTNREQGICFSPDSDILTREQRLVKQLFFLINIPNH